ncbi:MAG: hypothetical protein JO175_07315 [Candidatus Eremiobacteraeota bacterium]|nr:hypothetical protein [Candidatus Eremiobacteraeota bacterium]
MDIEQIINALNEERERLDRAIAVLQGGSRRFASSAIRAASTPRRRGARHMSAAARAKIGAAQRRRWAKVKAQQDAAAGGKTKKK